MNSLFHVEYSISIQFSVDIYFSFKPPLSSLIEHVTQPTQFLTYSLKPSDKQNLKRINKPRILPIRHIP